MEKRFNNRALGNIGTYGQGDEKKEPYRKKKKKQEESYLTKVKGQEIFKKK